MSFFPNAIKVTSFVFLSLSTLFFLSHLPSSPFPFPSLPSPLSPPPSHSLPPPPPTSSPRRKRKKTWILPPITPRLGLIDESGAMTSLFQVFDEGFDSSGGELVEEEENWSVIEEVGESGAVRVSYGKFRVCEDGKRDYVPCLDNVEEIVRLNLSDSVERFERHCPRDSLDCLVPVPKGYRRPILWPQSRDKVWFNNVLWPSLVEVRGRQKSIARKNDKYVFPGGGTQFIHGADQYLDQISQMVPDIAFGHHTRVALDIGCGVASFGAFLFQRNVTTLSIAPKDVHENQIQLALERGVPAMISVFAKHRLPYPSQAFDLMHCSRCGIDWTHNDGVWLLEANRMLRAGGYFVWAAQPVDEHKDNLQEQWKDMQHLITHICWELVKKEGYIAIWRKPEDNSCYLSRDTAVQPPLCDLHDDPDNVWYVNMTRCITLLPENGYGSNVGTWPARLHDPPSRLQSIKMDAYISRNEIFKAGSNYWKEIVENYIVIFRWREKNLRNVMDMRAGFGGFAAALHDFQIDCWVMNVVPVNGFNYLPLIYDRGLIGVTHDWCEPFDTYPRTYDLLHAAGLFSVEQKRNKCHISIIMFEIDRMLRPGGTVYIRDTISVVNEILDIAVAMGWTHSLQDTGEGPHASWKILICEKPLP